MTLHYLKTKLNMTFRNVQIIQHVWYFSADSMVALRQYQIRGKIDY